MYVFVYTATGMLQCCAHSALRVCLQCSAHTAQSSNDQIVTHLHLHAPSCSPLLAITLLLLVLLLLHQQKWISALSAMAKLVLSVHRVKTMPDPHTLLPNWSFHLLTFDRAVLGHLKCHDDGQYASTELLEVCPLFYVLLRTLPNGLGPLPGLPLSLASDAPLDRLRRQQELLEGRLDTLAERRRRLRCTGVYLLFAIVTEEFEQYTAEHEQDYATALRYSCCNMVLPKWHFFERSLQFHHADVEWQLNRLQNLHAANQLRIEELQQQQPLTVDSSDGGAEQQAEAAAVIGEPGAVEAAVTGTIDASVDAA
jgi:hypothetical protein